MAARILYVHVGPMKTGTSAIQYILSKHDNSAILYPKIGLVKQGSHAGLVYALIGKATSNYVPQEDLRTSFGKVADCARNSDLNLLISSEVLLPPITRPNAWRDVGAFVRLLLECLDSKDWHVKILLACREHFERAASAYNQSIKGATSRERRDPDEFLLENVSGLQYAPIVRVLKDTGFHVTALNYHPSKTWAERFLIHVGFPEEQVPQSVSKNVSLTPPSMIARLAANRTIKSAARRKQFITSLRRLRKRRGGRGSIFAGETVQRVEPEFRADRQFVEEEFGICLPEPSLANNTFFLDQPELAQIAVATQTMGAEGEEIMEIARKYLR